MKVLFQSLFETRLQKEGYKVAEDITTIVLENARSADRDVYLQTIAVGTAFYGNIPDIFGEEFCGVKEQLWLRTPFGIICLTNPEYIYNFGGKKDHIAKVLNYTFVKSLIIKTIT